MQTITEDKRTYADKMMKRFKLVDMREQYSDIIAEAESEQLDYMDFLLRKKARMPGVRRCYWKRQTLTDFHH